MRGAIPPPPNIPSRHGVQLKKYRDNFIFAFMVKVVGLRL